MDCASYVTSQYPVLRWAVPIELLRSTPYSNGLCQLSYFTALRAKMGCVNWVTSQYPVLKWAVPIELLLNTPLKCANQFYHSTPLKRAVPIVLLHSTPCSNGLCQLSYFTAPRAQMGCVNWVTSKMCQSILSQYSVQKGCANWVTSQHSVLKWALLIIMFYC